MTDHASHSPNVDASESLPEAISFPHGFAFTVPEPECATSSDPTASCPPLQVVSPAVEAPEAHPNDTLNKYVPQQPLLHDMLCHVQPNVLSVHVEDEGFTERDNDALRKYTHFKTNIVLTSTCPEVAPHIVVTPPDETYDDFYIPWLNRVDYHFASPSLLAVPFFDTSRLARMPYRDEPCYWPVAVAQGASMDRGIPRRVFRRSRFNQLIEGTEGGSSTMNHPPYHRWKALAIETSEQAKVWSERYTNAGYLESFEKPFQWSDPAEPLLRCANYAGVVIIDSPNPFSAPHIMICTPPSQDPWVALATATNDPQDGGYGRYLVVPSQMVSFVNMSPTDCPALQSIGDDFDETSLPSSPEPSTPIDLDDDSRYPLWDRPLGSLYEDEEDEEFYFSENTQIPYQNLDLDFASPQSKINETITSRKPIFFVDEEEDDLPPLDDWYICVASRNGIQIEC